MSNKNAHLTIRISPEELEKIKEFATSQNMLQSEFVLSAIRAAMGQDTADEKYILLSRRVADLEKQLSDLYSRFQQAA